MTSTITFHVGDVRDVLATMPDSSVDLLVTSPPFLALRSYLPEGHPDKHREIGSEPTPAAFLDTMLALTADWRRVVADWGSIAVEIGDTYSGSDGRGWPLDKSLCGIPTLYTWSLAYGRNLLTWTRPNPPVGALGDKFRPATSFVTVATVDDKRWFDLDAVREPHKRTEAWRDGQTTSYRSAGSEYELTRTNVINPAGAPPPDWWDANDWQPLHRLPTQPYKGSHYAAFPVALPARLIEAMCPREVCGVCGEPRRRIVENHGSPYPFTYHPGQSGGSATGGMGGHVATRNVTTLGWTDCSCVPMFTPQYRPGIVLDPFGGSGTTAVAAAQAGRDAVLIDIDRRNVDLTRHRIADAMQIVSETIDGDTWTWTVDPGLPGLKGQHPDQLSLLGDIG